MIGTKIYIYQWNAGKNKNFMVEHTGLSVYEKNTWTIPGKGDEAMKKAIEKAKSLAYPDNIRHCNAAESQLQAWINAEHSKIKAAGKPEKLNQRHLSKN